MKIVLDTNILVSGTYWKGSSDKIIELVDKGKIELIISKKIISEYYNVINRDEIIDKVKEKSLILNKSVSKIISNSIIVEPLEKFDIIKGDPDDNMILECAIEGKADYIITNDNHLLEIKEFKQIKIMAPEEFLGLF